MKFKWITFWCAGVLAGTLLININHSLLFGTQLDASFELAGTDWNHLFFFVLQKRLALILLAGLSSLTFFYFPAVLTFYFYFGFIIGAMTALSTMRFGLFGILYYLGTLLPQIVLYVPMWLLLVRSCSELHNVLGHRKSSLIKSLPALFVVLALLLGGVLLETYVNPRLLKYLFAFM